MKLLKQFHFTRATYTPLKRGVNERTVKARVLPPANFINTQFQPGVSDRERRETVSTVFRIEI
jgi:hypothetical protein